jgi:hypothetical protein
MSFHKIIKQASIDEYAFFSLFPSDNVSDIYTQYSTDLSDVFNNYSRILLLFLTQYPRKNWITDDFVTQKRMRNQYEGL